MRVLVATEGRYWRFADGSIRAASGDDYAFWRRYLAEFSEVGVLARVERAPLGAGEASCRADGEGVVFHPLDPYRGGWGYLVRQPALRAAIRQAVEAYDAFVLRVPGPVAYLLWRELEKRGRGYGVEVLGDPWEALAPGHFPSLWRPIARRWSRHMLRRICGQAPAACYVTGGHLQQQYPPGAGLVFSCSDAAIGRLAGAPEMERRLGRMAEAAAGRRPWQIGFLGSLETLCKDPETHLRAIRICRSRGLDLRFTLAGEGRCRPGMERLAEALGLMDIVCFAGRLAPGAAVEEFLDGLDLFLLASRAEGLPRAVVEAMARGCPVIASRAGGLPELLPAPALVAAGNPEQLAGRILEILAAPGALWEAARANLAAAEPFLERNLGPRRREFLREVRRRSARGPGSKLLHVATAPEFWGFLKGQIRYMKQRGLETHAASGPGRQLAALGREEGIRVWNVPLTRRMAPLEDLRALWGLWRLMRRLRPDIVHAHTPKAGLLSMLAARAARVPARLYTLHGLVWQTRQGWRRRLLAALDRWSCRLASRVISVSASVARDAVESRLATPQKIVVRPSANGVDFGRFHPGEAAAGSRWRRRYGLPAGSPVVGFIGRLAPDKGIEELEQAWSLLREEFSAARLVLVGEIEEHDPLPPAALARLRADHRVCFTGWVEATPEHYRMMDVCVLPSRREGLPYAALEAAATGKPVAGFRVAGLEDAVEDGVSGRLVRAGDAAALGRAVGDLLRDPELGRQMGRLGRERCRRLYERQSVWASIYQEYSDLLDRRRPLGEGPWWKRPVDAALALALVAALAPLLALVALAVLLDAGPPVLFRQRRPGLDERPFELLKFRTMRAGELPDRQRLTRLGRWLRRTSLDELPQLFNILRGEMSFIGPRPLLERYLGAYTPAERRRHLVRPGLSGWAQIHGRNDLPWTRRLEMDVWYVDHAGWKVDAEIAARTVWNILTRRGAREDPCSSMRDLDVERTVTGHS